MRRREFIALAAAVAAFPRVGVAQQAKVPRLVYFNLSTSPAGIQALQQGLSDYGYVDGRNITVEFVTSGTVENMPAVAATIAASKPDFIVLSGAAAALAMRDATSTIPIVFSSVGDPVGIGLVASCAFRRS